MVGEIRDKETSESAVQAALTGHLVLSTLHTNDAPSSITRLLDLGVPSFLISSTVIGIIAQRLVRCICPSCKRERHLSDEEIAFLGMDEKLYPVHYGEGCTECRGTGYRGRTGIFEVMEFTDNLRSRLNERIEMVDLQKIACQDGMVSLRQVAIKKMLEGVTTYEEVISVT
jgi:general secretion pathway protein E